ncbi:MAG TPA: protein-L-isoaspartate(D-aspartate) O-methyltransferase [Spirochaetes bacterium]|nr:protein-L-isoaspartate(D-aspartate) O-methyltransferase [Spirochaetota bacterium]
MKSRDTTSSMISEQIVSRGIKDPSVLKTMAQVPRQRFVPVELREHSFSDHPLGIGYNQTISQPYIVALMTFALDLKDSMSVLEVGTGSGYQTAILAELSAKVYTIERIPELSEKACSILQSLCYDNIFYKVSDGSVGWTEHAPFDRIIVTAGASQIPGPLIDQLNMNGILIIPVGSKANQILYRLTKTESNSSRKYGLKIDKLTNCVFVPLVGQYA